MRISAILLDLHLREIRVHLHHRKFRNQGPVIIKPQAGERDVLRVIEHRLDHLAVKVKVGLVAVDAEMAGLLEQQRDSFGSVRIVIAVGNVELEL